MDKSCAVEGSEDHVHLPIDVGQKGRYGERKDTIPEPIGGGGKRNGLGANLSWVDF